MVRWFPRSSVSRHCVVRSLTLVFVWTNMTPIILIFFLITTSIAEDIDYQDKEDRPAERLRHLRHSRFPKLDDLNDKIDRLGEVQPAEDKERNTFISKYFPNNEAEQITRMPLDEYFDYPDPDLDDSDDNDYDPEINEREEQFESLHEENMSEELLEAVHNYLGHPLPNNDPESEDDFADWDESQSDSDGTTAPEKTWIVHSPGTMHHNNHRKNRTTISREEDLAKQHLTQMTFEGSCKTPLRKVVSIQSVYPNPSKIYIPHCTFLHRCGDDAGCCKIDSHTCRAKETTRVHLYFISYGVGGHWGTIGRGGHLVEKLSFTNDTECECVPKGESMVKDETTPGNPGISSWRSGPSYRDGFNLPEATEAPRSLRRCHCTSRFSPIYTEENECICDCHTKQKDCLRIKRGREYFSYKDRLCIKNGPCLIPNCEFGEYIRRVGRCPRKHEQIANMDN